MKKRCAYVSILVLAASFMFGAATSPPLEAQEWVQLGLVGESIGKIAIHPDAPNTIFAAGGDVIYKSVDGGMTFDTSYVNPQGYDFTDVSISPLNANSVLAGDEGNVLGQNAHVFFTTNGGDSWTEFSASYPAIQAVVPDPITAGVFYVTTEFGTYDRDVLINEFGGFDLAVCPLDGTIYLGAGDTLGIAVSTDGGSTWEYRGEGLPLHSTTQVNDIVLHPDECSTIFMGVQTGANPASFQAYFSDDAGMTSEQLPWTNGLTSEAVIDPTVGAGGIVFIGGGQGVFRFPLDLRVFSPLNAGFPGGEASVGGIAAVDGEALFAGTTDGIWMLEYLPSLSLIARKIDDTTGGNGSGSAEPGELVGLSVYLYNTMFAATDLTGTIATDDPNITLDGPSAPFPSIQALEAAANTNDPFLVTVASDAPDGHRVEFDLYLTSNEGGYNDTLSFTMDISRHIILLVDDDAGATFDRYYTATFDTLDMTDSLPNLYDHWDVFAYGSATELVQMPWTHNPVVWFTGNADTLTLTPDDQTALETFITDANFSNSALITGQNIAEEIQGTDFLAQTLGIDWVKNNSDPILEGIEGDPMSGEMSQILTQGSMGANNQTSRDELAVTTRATEPTILYTPDPMAIAGVRYQENRGRVVFLGFGFEAVNNSGNPSFESRVSMMYQMLRWLRHPVGIGDDSDEPAGSLPRAFALGQNYPNPFNPQTSISYSVQGDEGQVTDVTLTIYDVRGRRVRTLVDGEKESGVYTVTWDGSDERGRKASSGIYFYRLESGDQVAVKKMVILK